MKYYLSSYELGNETEKLKNLIPKGKIGYIPNARNFTGADPERRAKRNENDMGSLRKLGFEVEILNLQDYFEKRDELKRNSKHSARFLSVVEMFLFCDKR
jgi:hypothetical protein